MSAPATTRPWDRLPPRLRPREIDPPGSGNLRLVETTLLLFAALLLAVATVNDVVRQTHVNERLIVDIATWRAHTGHAYHNLSVDQELLGKSSRREVVCGNTAPGAPRSNTQLCLIVEGPVRAGKRTVGGGWYLPPRTEDDVRALRYGCFGGAAARGMCSR